MSPLQAQVFEFPNDSVTFNHNRKSVKIPFKLVHNLIIIPVRINDSQPLNFILDTGVKNMLITKLHYNDSLQLKNPKKISIQGLGAGEALEAMHSTGNRLYLKGISGENQIVFVLLQDVLDLSMRMGMPIHGLIGYDIFKNFIVKVNYSSRVLTLYKPDAQVKLKKKSEVYPLEIDGNKAYLYAHVKQFNGDTLKVKLIVDTGASNTISLYLPSHERLELPPKVLEAYLGRGLSGDITGKIGRINSISFGRHNLENLPVAYPNEDDIRLALNISNRNGHLGADILKRFTVIFDYPHKRIVFEPNNKYKSPFNYNLAGFEVSTPLPGINIYYISHVVAESPASKLGIKVGDQLLSIDGKDCMELDINQLLEVLESRPGKKLKLKMRREHIPYHLDLVLQDKI
ncbi:aspartyl protease family protein [Pontibacter sp. SGAir0037]|uniref:aspartyl protease family protein n=1 Tax=Pontibacter sp. SGAir0037 TaxID=2571030 RepID=UPI001F0D09CF|nr:aspartyl protease family protein [Pontibacter sp. SGAir0037]